jgi:putative copper export protein
MAETVVRRPRSLRRTGVLLLWGSVTTLTVVLALLAAGGAPRAAPAGLPDAGPAVGWGLRLARLATHAAALAVVAGLLLPLLGGRPVRRRLVAGAAGCWAVLSCLVLVLGLSEVVGRSVRDVLSADLMGFYVREVAQGRAAASTALLATLVAVAVAARQAETPAGTAGALVVALVALVPPLLPTHAAGDGNHRLAQAVLVVHVLAAVLWVGGLAALALTRRTGELQRAASRFSPLALVCASAVAVTGVVSATLRLAEVDQLWTSGYGALASAKAGALAVLVAAGGLHRRRTLPLLARGGSGPFLRLAVGEVGVMAAAFGLAVALSRTPPPA